MALGSPAAEHRPPAVVGVLPEKAADATTCRQLFLMSGFEVRSDSMVVQVPVNVRRVLAFLAVRARPQLRSTAASTLWMDTTDDRAAANLRTVLWKARRSLRGWIGADATHVALDPTVEVDYSTVIYQARRLIRDEQPTETLNTDLDVLTGDLLPEFDEDWVLWERERLRQLRIHALEALCLQLSRAGRSGEAVEAGMVAVNAEPLRESAQRALITAHLQEGNVSEARRQYSLYRQLVWDQLGSEPSEMLRSLVGLTSTGR